MKIRQLVFVSFIFSFSDIGLAKIILRDDRIEFSNEHSSSKGVRFESFNRFKNEWDQSKLPNFYSVLSIPEQASLPYQSLTQPFLAKSIQGAEFSVSKSNKYAIVFTYRCEEKFGGQSPANCLLTATSLDRNGFVLSDKQGSFERVEIHDHSPYYLLIGSSCCDSPVKATLHHMNGKKICDSFDHRDADWKTKEKFECKPKISGKYSSFVKLKMDSLDKNTK